MHQQKVQETAKETGLANSDSALSPYVIPSGYLIFT